MRIASPRHAAVWVACLSHHVAAVNPQNPAEGAARKNAYEIFNAIHSAMRQWGSSLNHNGLSTFVATVPAGVTLYHGTWRTTPPSGPEWLAFEIEHAELFAHARWKFPPQEFNTEGSSMPLQRQRGIFFQEENGYKAGKDEDEDEDSEGHLQIYRTTKPVRLLYLDGTSAANSEMGTLDLQDFVLRGKRNAEIWDEFGRATSLCDIVTSWGLQGVIRMEAGFEIIKCDFSDSMELVSNIQRPSGEAQGGGLGWEGYTEVHPFEWIRAVAQRYHGIGASRVELDFSSMVSAMFYPVSLTNNKSPKPNLPRLWYAKEEELRSIRARVEEVVKERLDGKHGSINWQEVTDMIIARYADRLWFMAERVQSILELQGELNHLTNTHVDYSEEKDGYQAAISRCKRHYLSSVTPETQEDHLIVAAMEEVTHAICYELFLVRLSLENQIRLDKLKYNGNVPAARANRFLESYKGFIKDLMKQLRWTRWKECTTCGFDEVCFAPLWPVGDKDSYEKPNCRNHSSIQKGWWDNRYWDMPKRMPHLPKPPVREDL
ncbi:hypothetical protein QBC41DRAFT_26005 [Cercophora samala]|uniref:Uncharacterized protein n=1 Tax=Cercophora samala TaxID=330535 RepID=A0AA39Z3H4_9PEZI|nr:hypothetical protein QBC41DRAFT_26005 [Cercophora samala]